MAEQSMSAGQSPAYQAEMTALKADLAALRADLGRLTSHAAEDLKAQAKDRAEQVKAALQTAKDRGAQVAQGAEQKIHDHPWAAVAIAFGVGLVIGKLLDRR